MLLGVNIDHVATLRQARYARMAGAHNEEPDVIAAALTAEAAGAHSITAHLREDRRHIQDRDIFALRERIATKLNMEMGNAAEIIKIALKVKPDFACLVPENRQEITTEGGLDVRAQSAALRETVRKLQDVGTKVSMFIDPIAAQIEASREIGADMVELHTGTYANTQGKARARELQRLLKAGKLAHEIGLQVNAGHGITTQNVGPLLAIPGLTELNIGHHIISRSLIIGLAAAVKEMLAAMHRSAS